MTTAHIPYAAVPDWSQIPGIEITQSPWHAPMGVRMQAQVCWNEHGLCLNLRAEEKHIRAEHHGPLAMVCEDSCMEFFFRPQDELRYFNIEVNPNGASFIGFGAGREQIIRLLPPEVYDFGVHTCRTRDGWSAGYTVPLDFIRTFFPDFRLEKGVRIRANFYKCGHKTIAPHYLCWNPTGSPVPSFHRPQDFGELILT